MLALQTFAESLPARPYCTDDPRHGQTVRGRAQALKFSHVQPNTSGKVAWLVFDVDHTDGATSWDRLGAPPPTLSVENTGNGHAHLLYALEAPVPRTESARAKPLLYLAAVQEGIRRKLGADPGYSGHLCKNPVHPRWSTRQWADAYSLGNLAEWVTLPSPADMQRRVRDPDYAGLGRNCHLFERLRPLAYRMVRQHWMPGGLDGFKDAVRVLADGLNAEFAEPLPVAEVKGIASSVARWTWTHFDPQRFRAVQAKRGARKGSSRRAELLPKVREMAARGFTQQCIADSLGLPQQTVSRWLRQP